MPRKVFFTLIYNLILTPLEKADTSYREEAVMLTREKSLCRPLQLQ